MSKCISPAQAGAKRLPGPHTLHFLDKSRINQLLWHVHVHVKTVVAVLVCGILPGVPFDCAGSLKTVVPVLASWPRHLPQNSFIKWLLWHVHVRSLWEDLVEILAGSSLRGPCMLWCSSLWKSLVEIRVESSSVQILMPKSCEDPAEVL